jgi:hypothetical protein
MRCSGCNEGVPALKTKTSGICEMCGHHVAIRQKALIYAEGDKNNSNILLLCPSCHLMFDTYLKPKIYKALSLSGVQGLPDFCTTSKLKQAAKTSALKGSEKLYNYSKVSDPIAAGPQWRAIESIFREAMKCRKCFDQGFAKPTAVDVAQPRWIAPGYLNAAVKVLIISLNPGAGNTPKKQQANGPFRQILLDYKDGRKSLQDLFDFQRQYILSWGTPSGRFVKFYMDGMGLDLDEIALANIAWCAAAKNKWSSQMFSQCFHVHTAKLIIAIRPDIVILSGFGTHRYASEINKLVPDCRVINTIHYAHRKGKKVEDKELMQIKKTIAAAKESHLN